MPSRFTKGSDFEDYVASLYEDLGFEVKRNVNLSGQQIDLLISKNIIGVGRQQMIVECKYRSEGSVSNQAVIDLGAIVRTVADFNGIIKGILVTNSRFSADAAAVAQASGGRVELLLLKTKGV